MFQRGDVNLNRNYHIVHGSDQNQKKFEQFGVICRYDIKHDLNAACFKTFLSNQTLRNYHVFASYLDITADSSTFNRQQNISVLFNGYVLRTSNVYGYF